MKITQQPARMVYETNHYFEGCSETKFGFSIGDRVWWVGMEGYGNNPAISEEDKELCNTIISRWNAGIPTDCETKDN